MSPWSRSHRFRLTLAAALVTAALAGLIAEPVEAQERATEAVLLSGPTPVKGIPVYAPNRIPAFRGVYALTGTVADATESLKLTILYSRQDLLVPANWSSRRCGSRRLYQVTGYETFTLCYRDDRDFFLFFFFPEVREPAYWCGFIDPFIERFLYLFNFVNAEADVPFPAILQID